MTIKVETLDCNCFLLKILYKKTFTILYMFRSIHHLVGKMIFFH